MLKFKSATPSLVAADAGFRDERRALGIQPGEQQRRLQLRAGDRQRVTDAVQWFAVNRKRRRATFAGCNLRAHQRQRFGHTAHRPLHQRRVANQFAGSIVILALLGLIIGLLVKLGAIMKRVDAITTNVASATEWFSPTKVFKEIGKLFHKN